MQETLKKVAKELVAPGKGILAADESPATLGKRFKEVGVENTVENRMAYRRMLMGVEGLEEFISGMILHEETLMDEQIGAGEKLKRRGIHAGIKVDRGTVKYMGEETFTQGLDDLAKRLQGYKKAGATFAKWRSVLSISSTDQFLNSTPSQGAIRANAMGLALYAALCQSECIVPIVEPEILMDGDHSIEVSRRVTERVLTEVFRELQMQGVLIEGVLLKPAMVTPGRDAEPVSSEVIAEATLEAFMRVIPPALPGIVFLSGGQSEAEATSNLAAINFKAGKKAPPWSLSFSYGRALQQSVLQAWSSESKCTNTNLSQSKLIERARACSKATLGEQDISSQGSKQSTFVPGYNY